MSQQKLHPLIQALYDYKPIEHERLSWTEYFIGQALMASFRSPSKKLQVGCVITKDNRVIGTGYNGYFPGAQHVSINVNNHEVNTMHAEQNAIAFAAKNGTSTSGSTLYVTHYPCLNCAKMIIASGIKNVIYLHDYKNDSIAVKLFLDNSVDIKKFE